MTATASGKVFANTAIGLKPFAPFDLRMTRDASNNVTFTWQRRTRLAVRMIGPLGISVPLGEANDHWSIDIFADGTYAVIVTSKMVDGPSFFYSADEQTADGLTPGDQVYINPYQFSATVGRGYPLLAGVIANPNPVLDPPPPPPPPTPVGATFVDGETPAGTINSTDGTDGNGVFTLAYSPSPAASLVLVKTDIGTGVVMLSGIHFNLSGATITYTSGNKPLTGISHRAAYRR